MAFDLLAESRWEASATIAADTDWFSSDITARGGTNELYTVQFMLPTTDSVVSYIITNGGISKTYVVNEGNAVVAGAGYQFVVLLRDGDTMNIQHSTDAQNVAAAVFVTELAKV